MRYILSLTFITFLLFPSLSFGFDQGDLDHFKATNECVECDLSNATFVFKNLSGANLERANLKGANFLKANLTGANFKGANLKGAFLKKANLEGSNFEGADLRGANLNRANLSGANFSGVRVSMTTTFDGAILKDIKNPPQFLKNIIKKFEQKQIAEEKRKAEAKRKAALNPGFRDIKPGLTRTEIGEFAECLLDSKYTRKCYGIDNISFRGQFNFKKILEILFVDLGVIVQGSYFFSSDIYTKTYKSLKKKYTLAYEFNERDMELFNEDQKSNLYAVFENGQVALHIYRKKSEYSSELFLTVEYRDVKNAKAFVKQTKPKRASSDDF